MKVTYTTRPLLVIGLIMIGLSCHHARYAHTSMPPGFEIVTNGRGNYAARYSGADFNLTDRSFLSGTKQAAINRAWEQYDYVQHREMEKTNWHTVIKN